MTKRTDSEHYRARLDAEREAITKASCEEARTAHRALADFYQKLIDGDPDLQPDPSATPNPDPKPTRRA